MLRRIIIIIIIIIINTAITIEGQTLGLLIITSNVPVMTGTGMESRYV